VICVEDTIASVQIPPHEGDPLVCDERISVTDKSHKHKKKRKHHQMEDSKFNDNYHKHKKHTPKPPTATIAVSWLAPNLRVRIISKDYCKGIYYNQKVSFWAQ